MAKYRALTGSAVKGLRHSCDSVKLSLPTTDFRLMWALEQVVDISHGVFHCKTIVVPYELYELYDWGKVPQLYATLRMLRF